VPIGRMTTRMKNRLSHARRPGTGSRQTSPMHLWKAVAERDGTMDRVFVYAVRSTGVYCLPSCPARRPGRDQVVFFNSPEPPNAKVTAPAGAAGRESTR